MGKPCAHFGLGMGSRVHTLALAWAAVCTLWPWHRQAMCTLWPWHGQAMCTLWPWHGLILALAVQRWLRKKKKKKVSRNLLKFYMEAYKLILSTSAKNGSKIRNNEVFSLVLRFRPWPCAHFGLGMGSRVHTLALAWAAVCTLWPWHRQAMCTLWPWHGQAMCRLWPWHGLILALAVQRWLRKKKKKKFLGICSNFAWKLISLF